MIIKCSRYSFIEILCRFFTTEERKEGYCNKIPLLGNHIYINNIIYYFNDDEKYVLEYNECGQIAVICNEKHHIIFDLKDVTQIAFRASNEMGRINLETNTYYTDLFSFEF